MMDEQGVSGNYSQSISKGTSMSGYLPDIELLWKSVPPFNMSSPLGALTCLFVCSNT